VRLAAFFAIGAWAYLNRSWLVTSPLMMMMFVLPAVVSHKTPNFMIAYGALLTYGLLWFAFVPNWHWSHIPTVASADIGIFQGAGAGHIHCRRAF
jgi:hypothetical protein